ncbi:hypothetical protein BGZ98_008936, partial [Dissophora globulifera]
MATQNASSDSSDTVSPHYSSSQYYSQIAILKKLPVPYSDIYHALCSYDTTSLETLSVMIRKSMSDLNAWIDTAKLVVSGLEVEMRQENIAAGKQEVNDIDMIMNRFYPNIEMVIELKDKIGLHLEQLEASGSLQELQQNKDADFTCLTVQELHSSIHTIQSSWSSLKTMLDEVQGIFASAQTRRGLLTQMEDVLLGIEKIGLEMDRLQEERSRQSSDPTRSASVQTTPSSPTLSLSTSSLYSSTNTSEDAQGKQQRNTDILVTVDSRIETLASTIEALTAQTETLSSDDTKTKELQEQYRQLLALWLDARARREKIGEELKEERWIAVFEQVAGQVESMMESLDRAIVHCKGLVDQIKAMVREEVIPTAPIDRDHLYTIFKSFEAKHKYYAPAVNKMLNMLENGLQSRATKNTDIGQKHRAMKVKWEQLRGRLERVELDLDGIEQMLDTLDASIPSQLPTPPAQLPEKPLFAMRRSQAQAEWKSPGPPVMFQPPQQSQQQSQQRGRRPPMTSTQSVADVSESSTRARNRSPMYGRPRHRPWSPAPSIASLPSLLAPNTNGNHRALSPSPSRANSDKLRPWCPSTKTGSPSIPGIPHSISTAATYTPRSLSATRLDRAVSPSSSELAPARAGSSMLQRSRSTSCTASFNGSVNSQQQHPPQLKPVFSPSGSMSKLSSGAMTNRSSSPTPPATSNAAIVGSARRAQPRLPPPVNTNTSSRFRQNLAPNTPTQQQRRFSSPTRRQQDSVQQQQQQQKSSFVPQLSTLSTATRMRQASAQNLRSVSQMGYRTNDKQTEDNVSNDTNGSALFRQRRQSLGDYPNIQSQLQQTPRKVTTNIYESASSSSPPGLGSNAGSMSSMGLEICAVPPFDDEPTSPSTSSSSS